MSNKAWDRRRQDSRWAMLTRKVRRAGLNNPVSQQIGGMLVTVSLHPEGWVDPEDEVEVLEVWDLDEPVLTTPVVATHVVEPSATSA